eukprot:UN04182
MGSQNKRMLVVCYFFFLFDFVLVFIIYTSSSPLSTLFQIILFPSFHPPLISNCVFFFRACFASLSLFCSSSFSLLFLFFFVHIVSHYTHTHNRKKHCDSSPSSPPYKRKNITSPSHLPADISF